MPAAKARKVGPFSGAVAAEMILGDYLAVDAAARQLVSGRRRFLAHCRLSPPLSRSCSGRFEQGVVLR